MYSRAERNTGVVSTSTPAEVGPGSYLRTAGNSQIHGYAPFGSTAARELGAAVRAVDGPGPGAYAPHAQPGGTGRSGVGAGQPFRSRVPRFAVERAVDGQTPGPGEYTIPSSLSASKGPVIAPRAQRLSLIHI